MAVSIHFAVQVIGRSAGRSATAAAAYRAAERIADGRTGEVHDYRRKGGVVFSEVLLPDNAPRAFLDRSRLWNAVEAAERGADAQLCREIVAALPRQLTREQNIALARDFVQRTFVDAGMCVDWAYHDPDEKNENPHIHIMVAMREVKEDGTFKPKFHKEYLCRIPGRKDAERYMTPAQFKAAGEGWEKVYKYRKGNEWRELTATESEAWEGCKRHGKSPVDKAVSNNDWNDKGNVEKWREAYAAAQNRALQEAGEAKRVDHRSFERRGIERVPQVHLGPAARAMERRGVETVAGAKNRAIAELNGIVGRPDLPRQVRQDAFEEAYAVRSASVDGPAHVRGRVRDFAARMAARLREVAAAVARPALPRLFQVPAPTAADVERRRAVQEAAERRRNALAYLRSIGGPVRGPEPRSIADREAEAIAACAAQAAPTAHRHRGGHSI